MIGKEERRVVVLWVQSFAARYKITEMCFTVIYLILLNMVKSVNFVLCVFVMLKIIIAQDTKMCFNTL